MRQPSGRVAIVGLVGLVAGGLAAAGLAAAALWWPGPTSAASSTAELAWTSPEAPAQGGDGGPAPVATPGREHGGGGPTEADGLLPESATVFDGHYPGVGNLDPALLQALREAAADAAGEGITFYVSSGWRSPAYQEQLLAEAVALYGSPAEAAKWVAPADKSLHVSGDAIDIANPEAQAWLQRHGAGHGLCLVYRNEPWHFELRPDAAAEGCPDLLDDAAHDPRLQPDQP